MIHLGERGSDLHSFISCDKSNTCIQLYSARKKNKKIAHILQYNFGIIIRSLTLKVSIILKDLLRCMYIIGSDEGGGQLQ